MSQPTRADRRRQTRGTGSSAPPPRRDPMMPIYISVAVVVVLIVAIFGFMRWQEQRTFVDANATPSPGPNATAKPVQLADGGKIGAPHFKTMNSPAGGKGQTVDGVPCIAGMAEGQTLHIHPHLALFVNGKQIQIPQYIGFVQNPTIPGGGCLYWIHTHDASGIIHIESTSIQAPGSPDGRYTLGMLFDIWGQPLGPDGIGDFKGPVTAYVNGAKYDGDLRAIPMMSHQQITLEVGTPLVPPPNYAFPPMD